MVNPPLREMAPHIAFEVERMRFVVNQPRFMDGSNYGGALGESFLVHLRNLIDFLYAARKYPTDAIASDYSPGWKPHPLPNWQDDKERCNMLLNHPTYKRVDYEKAGQMVWKGSFQDRAAHIMGEWASFLGALPPDRRAWFMTPTQTR
jgi:hypothetical protein